MAVNKVVYGNQTLIDITDSTVNPQNVLENQIFYGANGARKIGQRVEKITINAGQGSVEADQNGRWIRPVEYPNLDLVQFDEGYDQIYLTYDLRIASDINYISLYLYSDATGSYTIERGHLTNNIFIVDQTFTSSRNSSFRQALDIQNGEIQLWRVKVPSSQKLCQCSFQWYTNAINKSIQCNTQPCVERKAKIDYIRSFGTGVNSTSSSSWACLYLKKDYLQSAGYGVVTENALDNIYYMCNNLVELNLSNINTSNWTVKRMYQTFYRCTSLIKIDLSKWDVSGWPMSNGNTFAYAWYGCSSLKEINISTWDTSNWNVKYMNGTFAYNPSLKKLDLSNWDTSNWELTYFYNVFDGCHSLQKLDLSNWDTSKWNPTSISYCFAGCYSLKELDLSSWDTSNWSSLISFVAVFSSMYSLKNFKQNFDTSKWKPTSLQSLFSSCVSLESLDLSNWDTSGWTTLTTLNSCFTSCISLKELKFSTFTNTVGDAIINTGIRSIFNNCRSIKKIDLSMIDCSNWTTIDTLYYVFADCQNLEQIVLPKNLNLNNVTIISSLISSTYKLKKITGQVSNLKTWPSFNGYFLQKDTVLNIFNMLPTISTATTLRIGVLGLQRVTDAEIAIATAKGWTVTT